MDWKMIGDRGGYTDKERQVLEAAARADPAFAKKIGMHLAAASDYTVEGFDALPATNVVPGTDLFIDVYGDVYDINAGLNDRWAILILAAVVDVGGNPTSLKTSEYENSAVHGYPLPLYNHIKIGFPGPLHWHAVLGVMPNATVNWKVKLFAAHSDTLAWDWSLWTKGG